MEYPVSLSPGRDWRTAALAAAVVAAVELVVLLVLAVTAFGLPFAEEKKQEALAGAGGKTTRQDSAPAAGRESRQTVATQARSETSVVVLNGNGITGAADLASGEVRLRKYILTGTGNAPRSDFRRTLIMYRAGFAGEAHRLAKDVGAKRVAPLDGMRASDLMGAQLALIVGQE